MAALASTPSPLQRIQHERFTTEQHGYRLRDLSLSLSGNIAASRYQGNGRTFIDLYFRRNSDSRDKLKLFYSKEFEKYSGDFRWRYVSFLEENSSKVVTCIGDKIEILDTNNECKVLRSCRVKGKITVCLAVRDGEIFIGLYKSQIVIVFNSDLKETKKIKLKGIQDGDYPWDLQVIKDTVFVCTAERYGNKAYAISESDGSIITQYTDTTRRYSQANSITVSERLGLVAVVWGATVRGGDGIIVYSLNENKSFLLFDVAPDVRRIRISDKDRTITTGNWKTGEIKIHDLDRLFSFDAMKRTLAYIVSPDECEELRKYFGVTEEEMGRNEASDEENSDEMSEEKTVKRMECLLTIIEERERLDAFNISHLKNAVTAINHGKLISNLQGPMEGYVLHGLSTEIMARQKASEDERNQLSAKLRTAEMKINELENSKIQSSTIVEELERKIQTQMTESAKKTDELQQTKKALEHAKKDRDAARSELKQSQLDFAKESSALKEVLNQKHQAMAEIKKRAAEDETAYSTPFPILEKTEETAESVLAADFGRLIVEIADNLTLDQFLHLTILFNLPPAVSDSLCRVSIFQSPGIKFLEEIRNRDIINMYDITNLQKVFAVLELENVKQNLLDPYQQRVGEELHELYKAKEMLAWEDVTALKSPNNNRTVFEMKDSKALPDKDAAERLEESPQAEAMKQSETQSDDRLLFSRGRHGHPAYIEHNIGREGGTMSLAGVSLTIPPGAIDQSHVIGLSVLNEAAFTLPREVDKCKMTPLVKLEPLGLEFKKPLQLKIPHSALIPDPKSHSVDVIVYSGQMSTKEDVFSDRASGDITWTEERCLSKQLNEKTVTVDIQCLSYLSASLSVQFSEPSSDIFRAVIFVDRVRNDDDDIILTVCFCGDVGSEYDMLLSDYQAKLPLEQYSTLHICRYSEKDDKGRDVVSLAVSSSNGNYLSDMQHETKDIAVAHFFAASRVSHQFKLKNQQTGNDAVDLVLTIIQDGDKLTERFLRTRVKDLMISPKSEDLLKRLPTALQPYEDLKSTISSMLEKHHCMKLATFFELSRAEIDRVENDPSPRDMLIKILDEREKMMPEKMIDLYRGLKFCHLDKIARVVSEYIDEHSRQTQHGKQKDIKTTYRNKQIRLYLSSKMEKFNNIFKSSMIMPVLMLLATRSDVWNLPYRFHYRR